MAQASNAQYLHDYVPVAGGEDGVGGAGTKKSPVSFVSRHGQKLWWGMAAVGIVGACGLIFWLVNINCGTTQLSGDEGHSNAGHSAKSGHHGFCYDDPDCGPATWDGVCQTGSSQSPINLPFSLIGRNVSGPVAELHQSPQYFQYQNFTLTNNGHSVKASFVGDLTSRSTLDGSLLGQPYVFSQIHFHWGDHPLHGSEHTVDFKRYPMEGHLVHYSAKFDSIVDALNSGEKGALAVIGVFYKEDTVDNEGLAPIVDAMVNIRSPKAKANRPGLRLASILPQASTQSMNFIQYYGSLTTPGCNEVVFWNVIATPEPISKNQMSAFRNGLLDSEGRSLVNNYRPLQKTNNRPIKYLLSSIGS